MSRYGDYSGGGGERWDAERFRLERERMGRGNVVIERDRFEEREERDRYEPSQGHRESSADIFHPRRAPPVTHYEEKERFVFEERPAQPLVRRPRGGPGRYYDEEGDSLEGSQSGGQMIAFERRRESIPEKAYATPPARRGPPRPTFIRRQSSLDTFDRKPMPRYGDRLREPPETISIPMPLRRKSPPRYVERDFEEIRIAEPDYYGDEDYRGYREREISTMRRRRADHEVEIRDKEVFEEREEVVEEKPFPRRGKTKMPMRLVNKRAVIELGYPFEQEGETMIILKALGKEHIDEVIRISREMNASGGESEKTRTTYMIEAPAPALEPKQGEVIERRTEIIRELPTLEVPHSEKARSVMEWDHMSNKSTERRSPSPSVKSHRSSRRRAHSSASTHREIIFEEDRGESSSTIHGPVGALIVPERERRGRDERSIKAEIRALEAEKKALKLEREMEKEHRRADRYREGGEIIIERGRDREEVVKIERDRKAPNPRVIKAMLATLT